MSLIFSDTILGITLIPFAATPIPSLKITEINGSKSNKINELNESSINNHNNNNDNDSNNNSNNNNSNVIESYEKGTAIAAERLNRSIRAPAIVSIIQNKFIQGWANLNYFKFIYLNL